MNFAEYREENIRNEENKNRIGVGISVLLYAIGFLSLICSWFGMEFLKLIADIIFYPTVFQVEGDDTPTISGTAVLLIVFFVLWLLSKITNSKNLKGFVKSFFYLPIAFNLGAYIWYFGNGFVESLEYGFLIGLISTIVKIVIIFILIAALNGFWFANNKDKKSEHIQLHPLTDGIEPNLLNRYGYTNNILRIRIQAKKDNEQYCHYLMHSGGLFDFYDLPHYGSIKKINDKDIQSYIDAVEILEGMPLGENVTFLLESNGSEMEVEILFVNPQTFGHYVKTVGMGFVKILKQYANEDVVFGLDTNLLLHNPFILSQLINEKPIVISKIVFEELDKKKNDYALGHQARKAMSEIEAIQERKEDITFIKYKEQDKRHLSPDEIIVKSYKNYSEEKDKKVIFFSNDRGARIIARDYGLIASDIYE